MTEAHPSGLFLFSVSRKNKTQVSPKTVPAFCGRQTSRLCPFFFFFSCLALKVVKIENKQCKSLFGLSINESLRPHVTSVARCIARAGRFSCQQASSQEFGFAPSDIPKCLSVVGAAVSDWAIVVMPLAISPHVLLPTSQMQLDGRVNPIPTTGCLRCLAICLLTCLPARISTTHLTAGALTHTHTHTCISDLLRD